MIVTTTHNIDGGIITKYIGICTGECVIGTGFLSGLNAGFADLIGGKSSSYENKLRQAKNEAVRDMIEEAEKHKADGLVGVDVDYTTFGNDIIGVIATGTAVMIDRLENDDRNSVDYKEKKIVIDKSNILDPISPEFVSIRVEGENAYISLAIFVKEEVEVSAVKADLHVIDIFGEEMVFEDLGLNGFLNNHGIVDYESDFILVNGLTSDLDSMSSVSVSINKYILKDGTVVEVGSKELKDNQHIGKKTYSILIKRIQENIEKMTSSKEVYDYLVSDDEFMNSNICNKEIMEKILSNVTVERFYGTKNIDDVIDLVHKMFEGLEG